VKKAENTQKVTFIFGRMFLKTGASTNVKETAVQNNFEGVIQTNMSSK